MSTTHDDDLVIDGLLAFVDKVAVPLEEENAQLLGDPRRVFGPAGGYSDAVLDLMRSVRTASAEAGYYAAFAPSDIGGGGLGFSSYYRVWEALYHRYGPGRILPYQSVAHWTSGPSFLCAAMHPQLKARIIEGIMTGTKTSCFAMSEPDAGSDALAMSTRAHHDGNEWIINGTKQWITHSPYADYAFVFVRTGDSSVTNRMAGITCFCVSTTTPGFSIDSIIRLFGHVGGNESILSFRDVRVPDDRVVGELHHGMELGIKGVSLGRMYNAGRSVGLARWALELATNYAKERKTFGNPISEYQGVAFQLADSAIDIYTAKHAALNCASRLDEGDQSVRDLAIIKAYATERCFQVYDRCIQILGGMGLTNEMKLTDGWHQAREIRIADGSGEILRRNIARALLKGESAF